MKTIIISIYSISLVLTSCSQLEKKADNQHTINTDLNEQELRQKFIDSVENLEDYWPGIITFMKTNYPNTNISGLNNQTVQLIYALEEEFFDETQKNKNRQVIRLIFTPTFSNPWSVKLELKNGKTYVTTKILSGAGGYFSGYLTHSLTQVLSDSVIKNSMTQLNKLNFWKIEDETVCTGFDGTYIFFEAINQNKYWRVDRWTPLICSDSLNQNLGRFAESLAETSLISNLKGQGIN